MIEVLIHAANILILLSFLVRDILWLRVLSILAGLCFVPYFLLQTEPLIEPVVWNLIFVSINVVQVGRLFRARSPVHLREEEHRLHQMVFGALTQRQLQRLLGLGVWRDADRSEALCAQGEALECLMILYSGRVGVDVGGERVAELSPGAFVGEMSFLTGEETSASVVAIDESRYVAWSCEDLRQFLEDNPDVQASMQAVLSSDMARKLRRDLIQREGSRGGRADGDHAESPSGRPSR